LNDSGDVVSKETECGQLFVFGGQTRPLSSDGNLDKPKMNVFSKGKAI